MASNSDAPAKPHGSGGVRTLGKYELQKQLGAGGMGAVYLAKDTQLKRLVALKVLPADKARNATLVRRFRSEAQAAAQLRHDNIVAVYENGEADGHLFIAMEYVDGTDLHELIRKRGKIPIKRSLEIVKQVAKALEHAHEHNIVHRDIKPSNLLIRNDGVVKLTDLGLARSVDDTLETDITRAGTTVGTVDYMSPEQGRNSKSADIRSDIYSLGCTWYHMVTGEPPYPEGSLTNKLQSHATSSIPNPQNLNGSITEGMVAVIQRMMAKRPQDRYQTPAELLQDLASPALTRGGVAEEVMTAINEDAHETVVTRAPKRGLPAGSLPPKIKAKPDEEEAKPSLLDWETLQPLLWGAAILSGIALLGITVAYFSGGFDFSSGKITKIEDRPNAPTGDTVVQSPKTGNTGPNNQQAPPPEAGPQTVSSPQIDAPADGTDKSSQSVAEVDPKNPYTPTAIGQPPANFDAEEIPDWSNAPATTAGTATQPGSAHSSTTPGGNPKASKTTTVNGTRITPGTNPSSPTAAQPQIVSLGKNLSVAARGLALTEALRNLPPQGAVIRLDGSLPYVLPQIDVKASYLRLEAENGIPWLLFRPAAGEPNAGLRVIDGVLELDGLRFALDRSLFGGSDPLPMVECLDGQLLVRRCAFAVWGAGSVPVRALAVGSLQEAKGQPSRLSPRVLLDHVLTQGSDLTAFAVTRSTADVVVRNSLLVSGERPVVEISGKSTLPSAKTSPEKSQRAIRLVQSTLVGRRTVMQVAADGPPPTTSILWQDSIAATPGAAGESVLLDAKGWPVVADGPKSQLANLTWTMKDSAALGFQRLAVLSDDVAVLPNDLEAWKILWNKAFVSQQFPATAWPTEVAGDVSLISLKSFDRGTLPALEVTPSAGTPPGCDAAELTEQPAGLHAWLSALAAKPTFPIDTAPATTPQVVTLEISKQQDLGAMLQSGTWPAGTVLEIVGNGSKQMTPVRLVNKKWKLTWRVQEGAPLTFTPKSSSGEIPALITVDGGQLEITNLRFQMPAAKKASITSLISSTNARLTLNTVWLQGVMTEEPVLDSLLHWTGGPAAADGVVPALICRNSVFTGSENGVRLDLGSSPAFLQNCLIVSRGDGLDLGVGLLAPGQTAGPLVADHLTISATDGAIHLRNTATDNNLPVHRLYVEHCVFAPPVTAKGDEKMSAVLSALKPELDLARVEWWGAGNGIAPEIPAMIRAERDRKPKLDDAGLNRWTATWNRDHQEMRLLTGPGGVVMTEQFSSKPGTIKPSQFALHTNAKASKWTEDGKPIGVDYRKLEPTVPPAKSKDAKSKEGKSATPPAAKPKVNQPDF